MDGSSSPLTSPSPSLGFRHGGEDLRRAKLGYGRIISSSSKHKTNRWRQCRSILWSSRMDSGGWIVEKNSDHRNSTNFSVCCWTILGTAPTLPGRTWRRVCSKSRNQLRWPICGNKSKFARPMVAWTTTHSHAAFDTITKVNWWSRQTRDIPTASPEARPCKTWTVREGRAFARPSIFLLFHIALLVHFFCRRELLFT